MPAAARVSDVSPKPLNPAAAPFIPMRATFRDAAPKKTLNPAAAPFSPMGATSNSATPEEVSRSTKEPVFEEVIRFEHRVINGERVLTTTPSREPWRYCDPPSSYDPNNAKQATSIRAREFAQALMAGSKDDKPSKLEPTVVEVRSGGETSGKSAPPFNCYLEWQKERESKRPYPQN